MFLELNVPINLDQINEDTLVNQCLFMKRLGWDGVAFNMHIGNHNINKLDSYIKQFPPLIQRLQNRVQESPADGSASIRLTCPLQLRGNDHSVKHQQPYDFRVYSRLTFIDNFKTFARLNFEDAKFKVIDLLAVIPTNLGQLRNLVLKMNVDIISLHYELTSSNNQEIEKELLNELTNVSGGVEFVSFGKVQKDIMTNGKRQITSLMKRDISLEICYAPAIKSESLFSKFMHLFIAIIRLTKSRNIILTNGLNNQSLLRSPYEVSNIALMLGLDYSVGKHFITTHARAALMHAEQRCTLKGIMGITISDQSTTPTDSQQQQQQQASTTSTDNSKKKRDFKTMNQS